MTKKLVKAGLLLIAAVMIVSIAFAGAASAITQITSPDDFKDLVDTPDNIRISGNTVILTGIANSRTHFL